MATTSEIKTGLDEISNRIQTNSKRISQAGSLLAQAATDLDGMSTTYASLVGEINTFLANNPDDPAAQVFGAEKDLLVGEFQALKLTADAKKTAYDGA